MAELNFCKQFLTALDSRPIKLSGDHIADARTYPAQSAHTLPRLPHPPHPLRPASKPTPTTSTTTDSPSSSPSTPPVTITLKPMKSTFPSTTLPPLPPTQTSIFDLKQAYTKQTAIDLSKIKILWRKKPTVDSKTVAETTGSDAGTELEFSLMMLPGAAVGVAAESQVKSPPAVAPAVAPPTEGEKGLGGGPAAQGLSGKEVVAKEEFWEDLRGFVVQRIRDEKEGERLVGVFRGAWEKDR